MNYTIPTDAHELSWLKGTAINAHCDISAGGRFTSGFGVWHTSTVSHLLSEARHAKVFKYGGELLPLLGVLSAIEQFGICYEPIMSTFPPGYASMSYIIKCAHHFLNIAVGTPDSNALYALRNGLMHQASLISVGQQNTPKHYWFEIDNKIPTLFSHPSVVWDGQYNTRSNSNRTVVNASKILDLALIDLPKAIRTAHASGKLKFVGVMDLREFLTTFVNLEFDVSFRDSYIKYLERTIYEKLESPPAGAASASEVLAKVSQQVQDEAAVSLAKQMIGPEFAAQLSRLKALYPVVK